MIECEGERERLSVQERKREREKEREKQRETERQRDRGREHSLLKKKKHQKAEPIITCQYILIRFFVTGRGTQSLCRPACM